MYNLTKHLMAFKKVTAAVVALTALTATAVHAEDAPPPDQWQFEVTPYLFAAGLNGETGIGKVSVDVDMSFSDLLDYIDSAFMMIFEARKGPWGFGFDGIYTKLEDEEAHRWDAPDGTANSITGELELTMTEQIYQLTVAYRVHDSATTKLDLFGAGRYTQLDVEAELTVSTAGDLTASGARSVDGDDSWWDPLIGFRILAPVAPKWTLVGYADVGGFGVGSDTTYQLIVGANWAFAKSWTAKLGYRHLYQDYEDDDNKFNWEMAMMGAYLGLGYKF